MCSRCSKKFKKVYEQFQVEKNLNNLEVQVKFKYKFHLECHCQGLEVQVKFKYRRNQILVKLSRQLVIQFKNNTIYLEYLQR